MFKGCGASKTRLELPTRVALAEAFLLDTLSAALGALPVSGAVLVTSDAKAAERARAEHPQLIVVKDPGGLNEAVTVGVARALAERPLAPVVVLTADLPALESCELEHVLTSAQRLPAVVPDREGSGTTSLLLTREAFVQPAFGSGSLARHCAGGCRVVDLPTSSTLRLDVDTLDDLHRAEAAGVGAHTARELAAIA
ncbi:2-phospho-L-lactate guanylyltransferase [Rathayibacter toxicus]|nr:hypothetical protein TI83_07560 [Rathayibacter toxicus]ALS57969.1 hypothetical protein APU90_09520 [Rathayibacter toxicus]PPH22550.1 2-phospho-L-lactate guanylyltransferase [Rathayibacter toxicus]PPH59444.1 2-phospho-L-lactate guanylyltransferase [Rathayibacter toxicus]PPH62895.1 2-phospho-L-lactate guanylyltransferase [Rathayibacter toxicus]